ncbi:MAG: hypothetical protein AB1567_09460 [bacterium]
MKLNEKQRNFLTSILEKASVYILTIIIVGNILNKEITLKSASSGVKRGEGGEKEGYFDKFGRELRIR